MPHDQGADPRMRLALARYQAISAYLAMEPGRGTRMKLLEQLAKKTWTDDQGEPMEVTAETLRCWLRRYRRGGINGLMDKQRTRRGVGVLSAEQCELVCSLKQEVPERSLEAIIRIAEDLGRVPAGTLRRSTVHRVLAARKLSARPVKPATTTDLDRFEADHPNDLWQSDLLKGPWLPDPARPGKTRQALLYAFLDDHSRMLLHGRFSFREDLPILELVFRRAVQRWGKPRRVYYDNGQVYRAHHMQHIVASLGAHKVIYTREYRPEGHGKIEAFNRSVRGQFLCELKASSITTLDQLNEAFRAWCDLVYNVKPHSETGEPPLQRWKSGADRVKYADEEVLRQAFLWKEDRTPDKAGVFSLLGTQYQAGPGHARRKFQVRFDPEAMHEVELWRDDKFLERARPLQIGPHRRPVAPPADCAQPPHAAALKSDWLGHLARKHREQSCAQLATPPTAQQLRQAADQAVVDLLAQRLDPAAFDEPAAREWLFRFGPLDPQQLAAALDSALSRGVPRDQHVRVTLDFLLRSLRSTSP